MNPKIDYADLETELAESIHRARNDLHAVAAMLKLQANASRDAPVRGALLEAETRVRALSSLNARLDLRNKEESSTLETNAFLEGLVVDMKAMHFNQRPIALEIQADPGYILVDHTKPLGLIINELVINALKYAFPEGRSGTVSIELTYHNSDCVLIVRDNGVGINLASAPRGTGLGRRMVQALAARIGGAFEIGPSESGVGTECIVRWPFASQGTFRVEDPEQLKGMPATIGGLLTTRTETCVSH